jgi:isopenicillin-N epimerase
MKDQFLLDPDVIFLNHGSFGACPRPVFDVYQRWQRELERQPVEFLGRRVRGLIDEARAPLADYLYADTADLAYIVNATAGVNIAARAVASQLQPGDEVLTTDQEYGACVMAWEWELERVGARLVIQPTPLPLTSAEAFIEALWAGVTPRTRAVYLSHMTSATALIFPVEAVVRRARSAGLTVVIDGAHVPGHIPLDLTAIDADFYVGNLHKWLCAPKGAAFIHVRRDWQDRTAPLYVSWGGYPGKSESFARRMSWQGTHDPAAALSVPAAIQFQREHGWDDVRAAAHQLARRARAALADLFGTEPLSPDDPTWFSQMIAAPLPEAVDAPALAAALYDHRRIEIPATTLDARRWFLRASFQAYNTPADLDALLDGLKAILPTVRRSG